MKAPRLGFTRSGAAFVSLLLVLLWPTFSSVHAADSSTNLTHDLHLINLATALRLAGAQNLDIQIARERLAEAKANLETTLLQFFPWISPGVAYRRHDNLIQDVAGNIVNVHKEAYLVGPTIVGQAALGDALY